MRFKLLWLSAATLSSIALCPLGAFAASGIDCRQTGLAQLRAAAPDGYAIYRQTPNPSFFASWIDCADAQFDLPTAVHESTHSIAAETDAFPLVGGGTVSRPHVVSGFFAPATIADRFETDTFTSIYLRRGKASSSTDFLYLLDELNAYTHDLEAAVDLAKLSSPDEAVDHRDGLAAMMAFVEVYAETAQASEPATWSGLRRPEVAATIAALWGRAEHVMARSCRIANFGTFDKAYIERACAAGPRSALGQILGRAPACPAACLEPDQPAVTARDGDLQSDDALPPESAPIIETQFDDQGALHHHPFAGNVGARRHRVSAAAE